jgi:hypothetical protein
MIVPIERSDWISPHAIHRIQEICSNKNIEVAFPKPFCSFAPATGILKEFRKYFKSGRPEVSFVIEDNRIRSIRVIVSAPCGATYYTARGLEGREVSDDLGFVIDKQLSCYPCTADTAVDREFGDSITHQAVKIQRVILKKLVPSPLPH